MSSPRIRRRAVPHLCGNCAHTHHGLIIAGGFFACGTCACTDFTPHAEALQVLDAQEAADADRYPQGTLLDANVAAGMHEVLRTVEGDWHATFGWDAMPGLGVLLLGEGEVTGQLATDDRPMMLMPVKALQLRIPSVFWTGIAGGQTSAVFASIASLARTQPTSFEEFRTVHGLHADATIAAWWSIAEAYQRDPDEPGRVVDELRQMICVDADERVHEVTRRRSDDTVTDHVAALEEYRSEFTAALHAAGGQPAHTRLGAGGLGAGGLPTMIESLVDMMRVTRTETLTRDALDGAR